MSGVKCGRIGYLRLAIILVIVIILIRVRVIGAAAARATRRALVGLTGRSILHAVNYHVVRSVHALVVRPAVVTSTSTKGMLVPICIATDIASRLA